MTRKVLILGSGCAGCTAAIYAGRANLNPLMIEGLQPGGQLTITSDVENYPGFPKGVMGPDLMIGMKEQALKFGTDLIQGDVTKVDLSKRPFKVHVGDTVHETETLIVATGASAKWIGLESEKALWGRGVSACATCDAFFFKNQHVVIVGGGDTAMEEATYLTKFASKVTVIHRRDTLRASQIMQKKAQENAKISFIWNTAIEEVMDVSQGKVTGVKLNNLVTGEKSFLECEGLFVAIGHQPNTQLFKGQLKLDEHEYIVTEPGTTRTSVDGVFACGDVQDSIYRQAITAAGTGCMSAIDAERWLALL